MRHLFASLVSSLAFAVGTSASAFAGNQYLYDDGVANAGLTYAQPADYCWFQCFQTIAPNDDIVNVQIMWPVAAIPAGTQVHVCVWEDPNDDGDPTDAVLVEQQVSVVPLVTYSTFTTYALPAPAGVHGKFFVGAFLTTDGTFPMISMLDYDSPLTNHAWYAAEPPKSFDPSHLASTFCTHIEVLGAGIHGVYMMRAEGAGAVPTVYCTAKTNSLGCHPQIDYIGTPSASAGAGFHLFATNVLNRAPGMLLYSTNGHADTPFGGGTLCIASPIHRTPVQNSGGSFGGLDCTGTYHFDFAAWIAGGNDPTLVVGTSVNAQFYSRDAGFLAPDTIGLTNAIDFTIAP